MDEHSFRIARGRHKGHHERYSHSPGSADILGGSITINHLKLLDVKPENT